MPFNTFTSNTKIKSSEMNDNFNNTVHKTDLQKITNKISVPVVVASPSGAFDLNVGSVFERTLDGTNGALSLSNETVGQKFEISLTQDGTGGRTVSWFTTIKWPGNIVPTLSASPNKKDRFGIWVTGAGTYDGVVLGRNL